MGLSDQPFEIGCPDCGAMMKVDPVTRAVIAHTPAPRKRTFEDLNAAAKAAKDADARRDSIFAQSVEAQKNSEDVMAKKFAEAMKKAKESPTTEKPLREFDLD
jgi:acyl-CoA reductase-like NAD-dependent aldehyde dehydrogenase